MEYSSFYGGRRGASFAIVKNFATVQAMTQAFRDGSYSLVKFDEYVLIDTTDKSHPDNGKIFKRGYGYNSGKTVRCYNSSTGQYETIDAGGAQYIGNIGGTGFPSISKAEVLIQNGDQITISKWYGIGIIKNNVICCTLPLNKVLSDGLSRVTVGDNGTIAVYYDNRTVASKNLSSLTNTATLSASGVNLQIGGITYSAEPLQTNPTNYSIVGLEISNIIFTLTNT